MSITAADLGSVDDYRAALIRGLKEKPKGKFILAELTFGDGKKLRALLFGKRFDELKKHCSEKRMRTLVIGTVDTRDDGIAVFTPSTGTLTDRHLEDLRISKVAALGGKGKASDAEKYGIETVPGLSQTVQQVLADVSEALSDGKDWKHPYMQQELRKLADQIRRAAAKDALRDIRKPYEQLRQLTTDAKLIPGIASELKRMEPVVATLRKADDARGRNVKDLFDEARDTFSRGSFVACKTCLAQLRRKLPGGPEYEPPVPKAVAAGAALAPDYKRLKTALEANIKQALNDRTDKFEDYREECQRLDTFFRKQAKGELHKKLVEIDARRPGTDLRGLMTRALLVVQSYIQALTRGGKVAQVSKDYLAMLQDTHAELKKRLSAF